MPYFIFPLTRLFLGMIANAATGKMSGWPVCDEPLSRDVGHMLAGAIFCSLPIALAFDILVMPVFVSLFLLLRGLGWLVGELIWIAHGAPADG